MTERNDHTEAADQAERGADEMEERSERLADDIEGTREDWERKQADDSVPGAAGEPERRGEEAEEVAIAGSSGDDDSDTSEDSDDS